MFNDDTSNDLPMSANLQDIIVKHYVLDLTCHMGNQTFEGSVTLLCQPTSGGNNIIDNGKYLEGDSSSSGNCVGKETTKEETEIQGHINQIPQFQNLSGSLVQKNSKTFHDTIGTEGNFVPHETAATNCLRPEKVKHCVKLCENSQPSPFPVKSSNKSSLCPLPPLKLARQSQPFIMILDSYKLKVQKVEGMFLELQELIQFKNNSGEFAQQISASEFTSQDNHQWHFMEFVVKEHCIHVFMEEACTAYQFPHAVRIWYSTDIDGPSLKWTTDQDENPCVFTIGHFLNNRSLFPSQDVPAAVSTYHANITVDSHLTVLLTGDRQPEVIVEEDGKKRFSYFTAIPMPSSTFGIAVGSWQMETLTYQHCHRSSDWEGLTRPSIRLFFPDHLKEKSMSVLGSYLPCCLLEVQRILGAFPLHRLDVLIVPSCFDSLGMASPSLLFLSQSLLCPDGSLCMRVAHEICHTWFGIIIGPSDWTEEWMTEGFCTYLEDLVHAKVCQLGDKTEDSVRLRSQLHMRVLKAELQITDASLQNLRPNKGTVDAIQPTTGQTRFLKNGMNSDKKFMQVHYLKGYFLLLMLEQEVGRIQFLSFLRCYVNRYIFQLVSSQGEQGFGFYTVHLASVRTDLKLSADVELVMVSSIFQAVWFTEKRSSVFFSVVEFLQMYFETFPQLSHLSVDSINRLWLDCPGIPESLSENEERFGSNILSTQVNEQLTRITKTCRCWKKRKRRRGLQAQLGSLSLAELEPLQVVLLLDGLLDEDFVPRPVLDLVKTVHHVHFENAEVAHRWCELVVKHRHSKHYPDLQHFLLNHQAMGVYLYGEAMISESPSLIQLARTCFRRLEQDMPESVRRTVSEMLFAS